MVIITKTQLVSFSMMRWKWLAAKWHYIQDLFVWPYFVRLPSFPRVDQFRRTLSSMTMLYNPLSHNCDTTFWSLLHPVLLSTQLALRVLKFGLYPRFLVDHRYTCIRSHLPNPASNPFQPSTHPRLRTFGLLFNRHFLPWSATRNRVPDPDQSWKDDRATRIPHTQTCLPKTEQSHPEPVPLQSPSLGAHRRRRCQAITERHHPQRTDSRDHESQTEHSNQSPLLPRPKLQLRDEGHRQDDHNEVKQEIDAPNRNIAISENSHHMWRLVPTSYAADHHREDEVA